MIENFFATPLYINDISDRDSVSAEVNTAISNSIFKNDWQPDNDTAETTFIPNEVTDVIRLHNMVETYSQILNHASSYLQGTGQEIVEDSLQINASWFNKFHKDQTIGFHEHGYQPNVISGVYYHKHCKGAGDIQFRSPNPYAVSFPHQTQNYANIVNISVEEGMILLFPSWLLHKVMPNKTNETRVSLAFNVDFRYKFQE